MSGNIICQISHTVRLNSTCSLQGMNLNSVISSEIRVTLVGEECVIIEVTPVVRYNHIIIYYSTPALIVFCFVALEMHAS